MIASIITLTTFLPSDPNLITDPVTSVSSGVFGSHEMMNSSFDFAIEL
jgi:hypothetical protein